MSSRYAKNADFHMKQRKSSLLIICGILSVIIAVDLGSNGCAMFNGLEQQFGYTSVETYENFLDKTQPLVEQVKEQDDGFYRINQGYEYSKNDAMLLGYHGMTHYSSTFNAAVNSLTPKLGIAACIWGISSPARMWLSGWFRQKTLS